MIELCEISCELNFNFEFSFEKKNFSFSCESWKKYENKKKLFVSLEEGRISNYRKKRRKNRKFFEVNS